jgi:hypothetical protein
MEVTTHSGSGLPHHFLCAVDLIAAIKQRSLKAILMRACSAAWRSKSSTQPDGGEVLAKRRSVAVRQGSKEAWSKAVT